MMLYKKPKGNYDSYGAIGNLGFRYNVPSKDSKKMYAQLPDVEYSSYEVHLMERGRFEDHE